MHRTNKTALAIAAACALSVGLVACGGSSSTTSAASSATSAVSSAMSNATSGDSTTEISSADIEKEIADATLTADKLANVDVDVAYGDYEAMEAIAKKIQNYEADGLVVRIDGDVSHFGEGMSYNIVETAADGSGNIGTTFVIEGVEEDAYPADGAHVILTGKVMRNDTGSFYIIRTLPEFVVVQ